MHLLLLLLPALRHMSPHLLLYLLLLLLPAPLHLSLNLLLLMGSPGTAAEAPASALARRVPLAAAAPPPPGRSDRLLPTAPPLTHTTLLLLGSALVIRLIRTVQQGLLLLPV